MKKWTIEDSKELYNINGWGTSYFGINDKGDVYVTPCKNDTQIDLREVMDELALRDVVPPVLLRFPDILDNRIEKRGAASRKQQRSMNTKATTTWSILSR
jgi:arginine decarboxylase